MNKQNVACRLPRIRKRSCRSHELAWRGWLQALNAGEEWQLVHGTWHRFHGETVLRKKGLEHSHAWLEKGGLVYCPIFDEVFTTADYMKKFDVVVLKRFVGKEPAKIGEKSGNYGPWFESEIKKGCEP